MSNSESSAPSNTKASHSLKMNVVSSCLRVFVVALVLVCAAVAAPTAENWPQWRGPSLNGISGEKNLPVRWSKTENITWKLPLPAFSASTPIIWGDRIFLNVADGRELYLWCVDRTRGAVLWRQLVGGGNVQR